MYPNYWRTARSSKPTSLIDGRAGVNQSADSGDDAVSAVYVALAKTVDGLLGACHPGGFRLRRCRMCRAGERRRQPTLLAFAMSSSTPIAGANIPGGARSYGRLQRVGEAAEIPESPGTLGCQPIEVGLHGQQRPAIPDGDEELVAVPGEATRRSAAYTRSFQAEGRDDATAGRVSRRR